MLTAAAALATGMNLSVRDVEDATAALEKASAPPAKVAAASAVVKPSPAADAGRTPPLPAMVMAPPAPPGARPAAARIPADGRLTGRQLLDQAALEMRKGDLATAGRAARQAFALGGVERDAQSLLNQIDAEAFNRRKADAAASFDNAAKAHADRDFAHALGVLALVDPALLPDDRKARRGELLASCKAALDRPLPPPEAGVHVASAQALPGYAQVGEPAAPVVPLPAAPPPRRASRRSPPPGRSTRP